MGRRSIKLWRTLGAAVLALGTAQVSQASQNGEAVQIVRAGPNGAEARNFQDPQGLVVRSVPAGELMRVFGEDVGFYDVEIASGLEVWVYGQFLEEEALQDGTTVLRVTTSRVNMRPGPSASTAYMPIRSKLNLGDRVRLIERRDASRPLAEDWVKVVSPRRARAWVRKTETEKVSDQRAAADEWRRSEFTLAAPRRVPVAEEQITIPAQGSTGAAVTSRPEVNLPPLSTSGAGSSGTTQRSTQGLQSAGGAIGSGNPDVALERADRLYDAALAQELGDFGPVVEAYEQVLRIVPAGSTKAELAARRVQEAQVRMNYVDLKRQVAQEQAAATDRHEKIRVAGETRELARTPNWGRFDTRGWVTKGELRGEEHYIIEWGGDVVAEIVCTSGRYDLSVFDGFEVGVVGRVVEEARITNGLIGYPAVVDAKSLEVISGSGIRTRN